MENFWDSNTWGTLLVIAALLLSLLAANSLKRVFPVLQACLIPTSVLGGTILMIVAGLYKLFTGDVMFETQIFGGNGMATLEVITYHTLALGFIASTFKSSDAKMSKQRTVEIFNTGVTTVSTYLIQAILGFAITFAATLIMKDFFAAAGVLLPFGFGQGTGQAMNYGVIYETEFGFSGGKSFGLTIAALGFLSASIGGVIHLNLLRKRGKIKWNPSVVETAQPIEEEIQAADEIPMQGSMDKTTVQIAFVFVAYFLAYLLMLALGKLLPGMRSVIFGFNFLLGVLAATLTKVVLNFMRKKGIMRRQHINNFLMTRISNFFFDIMVVSGIAAIRLGILEQYWGIILVLGIVGLVATYSYNYYVAKTLFPDYTE